MSTPFPAPEQPSLPIIGSADQFPVHRIYCIGQNYAAHAVEMKELGIQVKGKGPLFFTKPADAIVPSGGCVNYPPRTEDVHHEIEFVIALGEGGRDLKAEDIEQHIFGYAVGIDLTRRDLQTAAKKAGTPWDLAKGFDQSAPMSAIRRASDIGHPSSARIWLKVNNEIRQDADISDMIRSGAEIISELSTYYELKPGDLFFTGTPEGVGPINPGDKLSGGIDGIAEISVTVK